MTTDLVAPTYSQAEIRFLAEEAKRDPYFFLVTVCRFKDLVPRFHRPLTYLLAGTVDLLAWSLDEYHSIVTEQIKAELRRRHIDWRSSADHERMRDFCRFVNIRIARGFFKTSLGVGTNVWRITVDPNTTMLIIHGTDDGAWLMCDQMGDIIKSDIYGALFPERIPDDPKRNITRERIQLRGRTASHRDPCVTAKGYRSDITGGHFNCFYFDDLVTEKMPMVEILQARSYLDRIKNLRIQTEPTTRIHIGTRYDDEDDVAILNRIEACVHINIPMEIHDEPTTIHNVRQSGTATLPEICPPSAIERMKDEALASPDGVYNLLKNQYLVTTALGEERFPPSIVYNRNYEWVDVCHCPKGKCDQKLHKLFIKRQSLDREGRPIFAADGETPTYIHIDPATLRYALGADPATSMSSTADDFAVSVVGIDNYGVRYQMKTLAGKGWLRGLEAIRDLDAEYKPPRIGVEQGTIKSLLEEIMKRDARWRGLAPRVVGVSHDNKRKEDRIDQSLAAPLQMGLFLLDPFDPDTKAEMIGYRPGKNAKDGRLDSLVIANSQLDGSVTYKTEEERAMEARMEEMRYRNSLDSTGMPTYSWAMETPSWFGA